MKNPNFTSLCAFFRLGFHFSLILLFSHCSGGSGSSILSGILTGDSGTDSTTSPSGTETTNSATATDSSETDYSDSNTESMTGSGENEEQAMMPPPSLENLTVSTFVENNENFAVVTGGGFDDAYNGHKLVITHVVGSAFRQDSQTTRVAAVVFDFVATTLIAEANADTNDPCATGDPLVTCVTIESNAIEPTTIANFNTGDSLVFAFYDPSTDELSEPTTTTEVTSNLVQLGTAVSENSRMMAVVGDEVYQVNDNGDISRFAYDTTIDALELQETEDSLGLEFTPFDTPNPVSRWLGDEGSTYNNYSFSTSYTVEQFAISGTSDSYALVFLLSYSDNTDYAAVLSFASDDIGGATSAVSTNCVYETCRPNNLKTLDGSAYFTANYPLADTSLEEAEGVEAAYFFELGSTSTVELFTYGDVTTFNATFGFDFLVSEDDEEIRNSVALSQDDGISAQVWLSVRLRNGQGDLFAEAEELTVATTISSEILSNLDNIVDLALYGTAIDPAVESETESFAGKFAIIMADDLYFYEFRYNNNSIDEPSIVVGNPDTTEDGIGDDIISLDVDNIVSVTYNADKSKAFLLQNADSSSSVLDQISIVDLATRRLDTTTSDGVIELSEVLDGYEGDINPSSIQYFEASDGNEFLIVTSVALGGDIIIDLSDYTTAE